jgi:hypothetical protein
MESVNKSFLYELSCAVTKAIIRAAVYEVNVVTINVEIYAVCGFIANFSPSHSGIKMQQKRQKSIA